MKKYTISDIMEITGVSKRTVHYYIGRGLVPPAQRDEGGFFYIDTHLIRIKYIRWLAARHISLQGIVLQMQGKSDQALKVEMEKDTPPDFNVIKAAQVPDMYLKISVIPGMELHMTTELYASLGDKMGALTAYIKKLSRES